MTVRKSDKVKQDEIIAGINISGVSQELLHSIGPFISKLNHIRVFGSKCAGAMFSCQRIP
jgi:hypothetical protein